jgi:hypothetical protein
MKAPLFFGKNSISAFKTPLAQYYALKDWCDKTNLSSVKLAVFRGDEFIAGQPLKRQLCRRAIFRRLEHRTILRIKLHPMFGTSFGFG